MTTKKHTHLEFSKNGHWIRTGDDIAACFLLADYPGIKRNGLTHRPSINVRGLYKDGQEYIPPDLEIIFPSDILFVLLYLNQDFELNIQSDDVQVLLTLQVDERNIDNFECKWFPDGSYKTLTKSRIIEQFSPFIERVLQHMHTLIEMGDTQDNAGEHHIALALENELTPAMPGYGLRFRKIDVQLEKKTGCGKISYQDANIPYLLVSENQENTEVFPLEPTIYYLGRAQSLSALIARLREYRMLTPESRAIPFPKTTDGLRAVPLGKIKHTESHKYYYFPQWEGFPLSQLMSIGGEEVRQNSPPYELVGFDLIEFLDEPRVEMVFVPAMTRPHRMITRENISLLEKHGLWAGAGFAWLKKKEPDRARQAFECALNLDVKM